MVSVLFVTILDRLTPRPGFPPPDSGVLWAQREEHAVFWLDGYTRAYSEESNEDLHRNRVASLRRAWAYFRKWWHGSPGTRGVYHHYVGVTNVAITSRIAIALEMTKSLLGLMFYRIPSKPEEGKWTKTPPAVTWIVNLSSNGSLFDDLLTDSFKHIKVDITRDDGETSGLSLHEASGVRLHCARTLAKDLGEQHKLRVLDLMFNATRYLQMFFLRCSKEFHDPCKPNPHHDFYNPMTSPATVALQYLGYLGTTDAQPLRLLWEPLGFYTHAGFLDGDGDHAKFFRVELYLNTVSLHRRHVAIRKNSLIQCVQICNPSAPLDYRRELAAYIFSAQRQGRKCCVHPLVFQMIETFATQIEDIFSMYLQRSLQGLAWALSRAMSVANIERRHLRNKRVVTHDTKFANLVSKGLAEEWRTVATVVARTMRALIYGAELLPNPALPLADLAQAHHRKQEGKRNSKQKRWGPFLGRPAS